MLRRMYSTCIFCNAHLGTNEVIAAFPVGWRLAYDAARGRLWVVCRRCERWNLSPLEERWEALEECERRFRGTRLRASTDQVGLARLPGGLELVRVGRPLRPELAAWRYGDQFGRRRRATMVKVGLGLGALGAVVAGGMAAGVGIGGMWWWLYQWSRNIVQGDPNAVVAQLPVWDGRRIQVRRKDLAETRLAALTGADAWTLHVRHRAGIEQFAGEAAVHTVALLLPKVNRFGGSRQQVANAVARIEQAGSAEGYFLQAAHLASGRRRLSGLTAEHTLPFNLAPEERLALEMAANEDHERRALEGELAMLERAWRDAEEIAAISDNLMLPSSVDEMLRRLRGSNA
jgi:hypothetical protein